ncbi:MAG: LamG domain-containing protein, partial [Verrucomicrobiales bacterium]
VAIPGAVSSTLQLTNVTPADNNAVFTARISNTVNGETVSVTTAPATITVQPYQVTLKHRYSFSETEGTEVEDSVGNADGSLSGNAVFANGSVVLDGSEFTYVDLPNGIISGLGFDGTIELWITNNTSAIWARIFDFGVSNGGEDVNDGGLDFLFLTPRGGDGIPRFTANFPGGGDIVQLVPQPPGWMPPGEETHVVISWMASKNQSRMYIDGVLVNTSTAPRPLSDLAGQDINNWLGRSQFPDAYWNGSYNEVRISSGAMNDAQVAASFAAGPTSLPGNDTPPKLTATRNGNNLVISWPAAATGFVLESTTALGAGATWTPVAGATQNGQNMEVSVPMEGNARFFRLRK